jgi:hypothetical protein
MVLCETLEADLGNRGVTWQYYIVNIETTAVNLESSLS